MTLDDLTLCADRAERAALALQALHIRGATLLAELRRGTRELEAALDALDVARGPNPEPWPNPPPRPAPTAMHAEAQFRARHGAPTDSAVGASVSRDVTEADQARLGWDRLDGRMVTAVTDETVTWTLACDNCGATKLVEATISGLYAAMNAFGWAAPLVPSPHDARGRGVCPDCRPKQDRLDGAGRCREVEGL